MSDHCGLFFDVDMSTLFDEVLFNTLPAQFRKLQSSHLKRVVEYNRLIEKQWDDHKIEEKLDKIKFTIRRDGVTADIIDRINNLDQQITDIMRNSEKNAQQ